MAGAADACNVFWKTAEAATLTGSNFVGTILSGAAISMTGGSWRGRAMATTDVTISSAAPPAFAGCAAPASQISLTLVKTGVVGPIDLEVTTQTTYTLTVTNSGPDASTGNIAINDDLRAGLSLASLTGANWNCVGPTSVVCTYTGPSLAANGGSTSVQITVTIAAATPNANNTGRVSGGGDPGCSAPPAEARCTSMVTIGTVPVTLSYVKSAVVNGMLQVDFTTLAEAGTAGFRVLAGNAATGSRQSLSGVLSSMGSSLEPQQYASQSPHAGESAIWIEEITSDGTSMVYGPYAVGSATGEQIAGDLIDWTSIQTQLDSFRSDQQAALRSRGTGAALEAEIALSASGLARVSYENLLAQGIDWAGIDPSRVQLTRGTETGALRYSGPAALGAGSSFAFQSRTACTRVRRYMAARATGHCAGDGGTACQSGRASARCHGSRLGSPRARSRVRPQRPR
jgi:uncharacterized repeat protein (TIGR01451 family)